MLAMRIVRLHRQATSQDIRKSLVCVGRNATLIVYDERCEMMVDGIVKDESHLDDLIGKVNLKCRATRGPHFVHSEHKLFALQSTLLKEWPKQNGIANAA